MNNLVNRKELFWDIRPDRIQDTLKNSDEWVIIRVFEYGDLDDISNVIKLYGEDRTKKVLLNAHLKPISASMAHLFLGVDKHNQYAS